MRAKAVGSGESFSLGARLGITAIELLPVFQFDEQDCPPGRVNYWGYAPISFFAPTMESPGLTMAPRTFLFAGKAAPAYAGAIWDVKPCPIP